MRIIYNYDRNTKEYIGKSNLEVDDFGKYNPPAFSTFIKPAFKDGYKSHFDGKKWLFLETYKYNYTLDHKGNVSDSGELLNTNMKCPDSSLYKWVGEKWQLDIKLLRGAVKLNLFSLLDEFASLIPTNETYPTAEEREIFLTKIRDCCKYIRLEQLPSLENITEKQLLAILDDKRTAKQRLGL